MHFISFYCIGFTLFVPAVLQVRDVGLMVPSDASRMHRGSEGKPSDTLSIRRRFCGIQWNFTHALWVCRYPTIFRVFSVGQRIPSGFDVYTVNLPVMSGTPCVHCKCRGTQRYSARDTVGIAVLTIKKILLMRR